MRLHGLRERIARVLYYEDHKRVGITPWEELSDDRMKPWRMDAARVLESIELDHIIQEKADAK